MDAKTRVSSTREPAVLTVADVAAKLQISERTVFRWKDAGKLPQPMRLGGWLLRWDREQFEEWLEKQSAASR